MNLLSIKNLLVTALGSLCLSMSVGAETMSIHYQMNPELEHAIGKMRNTHSNVEVLQVLSAIQDRSKQATQVILASMNVLDLEQRNEILAMLFQLPLADDGLNADHIPLLVQLYVKSAQSPATPFILAQRRSFIQKEGLNFRLLAIVASLLHAESPQVAFPPGEIMPRLLRLLEAARGSRSLSATNHQIIEDAIFVVKKALEDGEQKDVTESPIPLSPNPSVLQAPEPKKAPEAKPTTSAPNDEPASSTPWSIIVVLIVAAGGLLWLLFKRRS